MTRLMYDSTNVADIPVTAKIVGFYIDGIYATSPAAVRARFPVAELVPISAIGTNNGVVGDVEPGCMTAAQGVTWVRMRRAAGFDPTIYCNETYGRPLVVAAFAAARVALPHLWEANYDNVPVLHSGEIARQYANPTITEHHYDLSVVADDWPGVDGLYGASGGTLDMGIDPKQFAAIYKAIGDGGDETAVKAIIAAVNAKTLPAPVIDVNALATAVATAVVPLLPQPQASKPPAAPQVVKDWIQSILKYFGWA